jgi:hypothetical protein
VPRFRQRTGCRCRRRATRSARRSCTPAEERSGRTRSEASSTLRGHKATCVKRRGQSNRRGGRVTAQCWGMRPCAALGSHMAAWRAKKRSNQMASPPSDSMICAKIRAGATRNLRPPSAGLDQSDSSGLALRWLSSFHSSAKWTCRRGTKPSDTGFASFTTLRDHPPQASLMPHDDGRTPKSPRGDPL